MTINQSQSNTSFPEIMAPRIDLTGTSEYPDYFRAVGQAPNQQGDPQKRYPKGREILSRRAIILNKDRTDHGRNSDFGPQSERRVEQPAFMGAPEGSLANNSLRSTNFYSPGRIMPTGWGFTNK